MIFFLLLGFLMFKRASIYRTILQRITSYGIFEKFVPRSTNQRMLKDIDKT